MFPVWVRHLEIVLFLHRIHKFELFP
jgi:hypothetical protein